MVKVLLFDFSRVLLFSKDSTYTGDLNPLNKELLAKDPQYDYFAHFRLNEELLYFIARLTTVRKAVLTSGTVQDNPAVYPKLTEIFEAVFSAEKLGISKKSTESYEHIALLLGVTPEDCLFVDDSLPNIAAAKAAGMSTHHYIDNQPLYDALVSIS